MLKIVIFFIFLSTSIYSQDIYSLNLNKEIKILSFSAINFFISETSSDILSIEIDSNVNSFDNSATKYYSPSLSKNSDVILISAILGTGLYSLNKDLENNNLDLSIMYSETILLSYSVVQLSKTLAKRERPYIKNYSVADSIKSSDSSSNDSFFSGHTTLAFASASFLSKVYSDLYPDSKYKKHIIALSFSTAATVGYLRYRSGKHYPSDIITGAIVGSSIGYLIPKSHIKKEKPIGFSTDVSDKHISFNVNYNF